MGPPWRQGPFRLLMRRIILPRLRLPPQARQPARLSRAFPRDKTSSCRPRSTRPTACSRASSAWPKFCSTYCPHDCRRERRYPQQLLRIYQPGRTFAAFKRFAQSHARTDLAGAPRRPSCSSTFVNAVDPNRFDWNFVRAQKPDGTPNPPNTVGCMAVAGTNGNIYPGNFDTYPNCLHASSTVNIHFHGTHTNPGGTGDNVFQQILPLPRDNAGNLTTKPTDAMVGLRTVSSKIAPMQLTDHPLNQWPTKLVERHTAGRGSKNRSSLLKGATRRSTPDQNDLGQADKSSFSDKGGWPQYNIGVTPYCFVLPHKPEDEPVDKGALRMGQSPGTQWYHAHKHGSTAIDVLNGMTGAFIIEGQYRRRPQRLLCELWRQARRQILGNRGVRAISRCWCSISSGPRQTYRFWAGPGRARQDQSQSRRSLRRPMAASVPRRTCSIWRSRKLWRIVVNLVARATPPISWRPKACSGSRWRRTGCSSPGRPTQAHRT